MSLKPHRWLEPLSWPYAAGASLKNWGYDLGWFKSGTPGIPVISVGNLSAGGTGKTPHVLWLAEQLRSVGPVGILSRGYGRSSKGFRWVTVDSAASDSGDEPLLIKQRRPECAVAVDENRLNGAQRMVSERPDIRLILLDDGFQHRRIQRQVDLLLSRFDAPWWKDRVIPAGYLREPSSGSQRADIVIFTSSPETLAHEVAQAMAHRAGRTLGEDCFFSCRRYAPLRPWGPTLALSEVQTVERVVALSGIAHPEAYEAHIRSLFPDREVIGWALPDHARFDATLLQRLSGVMEGSGTLLTLTEKDAVRIGPEWPTHWAVAVLPINVSFLFSGGARLVKLLEQRLAKALV